MRHLVRTVVPALLMGCLVVPTAAAQITTGTVSGRIADAQGGVLPGATVILISESRGTRSVPAITNATGDWTFPNTTPDTYTVEVTMPSFKVLTRRGVTVSGGDRVSVGTLVLEVGGTTETVDVTAEAPLIQAQSGERSFAVSTVQIENLPIDHNNFTSVVSLMPGMEGDPGSSGQGRAGGGGQNNVMMDGISAMDTGNNGQMLRMNVESIAEVKVLTSGYQAEYGRSSGLQITAVTKSGTNRFHGSVYDILRDSDWDTNSWTNQQNGEPKTKNTSQRWGYSVGGPVGRPGGDNRLFFFYSHEFRPSTSGGTIRRYRFPTALERTGDFSESLDNRGRPIPALLDPATGEPFPGNVIPADRLYQVGLNILSRYPLPNVEQTAPNSYNWERAEDNVDRLTQQPAFRVDYQLSPALRFSVKYSGQRQKKQVIAGRIPGFTDALNPYPYIHNWAATANYTINPTTFIEGTYGMIQNRLAGPGSTGIQMADSANRLNSGLSDLPLIYPDAGVVDERYYQYKALTDIDPPYFDGTRVLLPPRMSWGSLIGSAPPNQQYPGWLNINRTQDVAISLTKVAGRHTIKAGFYNNHSWKAQNVSVGGGAQFEGVLNFGNSSDNPLDTGFGYANAALGIFTQYQQQNRLLEGNMLYDNREFFIQDNWKVTNRLTLDYGLRFVNQTPQADQFLQMSNFFPEQWSLADAPLLYAAGCSNGAMTCSGDVRNAMNPVTGEILQIPGLNNTQALIGTVIPNSGNVLNGIRQAGDGISEDAYTWPTLAVAPRFGAAYDLTGTQSLIVRGGGGLFFDRPDGNTVFGIPGNPPVGATTTLVNSRLQELGQGASIIGASRLNIFQYDAKLPSDVQWNVGTQMALPWSSSLDIAYVGHHGFNRLGAFQSGSSVNLNAVDLGAAYLPENQDLTLGTSATPGANALPANNMRAFRGLDQIRQQTTDFYETYHSLQFSYNRRFRSGIQFGFNYTLGLSNTGNTGLQQRLQHAADGSYSIRADQAQYEDLNKTLDYSKHLLKANFVWDLPDVQADTGAQRVVAAILNDWQVSGIWTGGSRGRYDLDYRYQRNGTDQNLTGSPDFAPRIVILGDLGSGCSDDQYRQFNVDMVTGPQYGSVGLESGRNYLNNCMDNRWDLSLARTIRLGGGRSAQFRVDAFNAFNTVIYSGVSTRIDYVSPTDLTIRNEQAPGGVNDPGRLIPRNAGFGAVTNALALRTVQATVRFSF